MQIDFGQDLGEPLSLTGFLDKKGSIRKNWKNRYFLLRKGSLSVSGIVLCLIQGVT
jgi:hypothetical protein